MALLTLGISHKTAPIALREQLTWAQDATQEPLQNIINHTPVREAAILTTCNRTEIYYEADDKQAVIEWLCQQRAFEHQQLAPYLYCHQDLETVRHMIRVASGLDSLVLGEPQILGQMKQAFHAATLAGTIGQQLRHLFEYVFATSKQVRTDTAIGANPISVAYAAVHLAKQIFPSLNQCTALLIGAGDTIDLMAKHLVEHSVTQLIFTNRTLARAEQLARKWQGQAIPLTELGDSLPQADMVFSATASMMPILGKGTVESALKIRKRMPILMLDMAVPRDIEPEVASLEDIYLYTVDDLRDLIDDNVKSRQAAAAQAEQIIDFQAAHYMRSLREREAIPVIRHYREQTEQLRDQELAKALKRLQNGMDAETVLYHLARSLTNKFLHSPSSRLRQAAYEGQIDALELARQLFNLKDYS